MLEHRRLMSAMRNMLGRMWAILGWFGAVLVLAVPAVAGTITMQLTCSVDGTNLLVQVLNTGNEAAQNVMGRVEFNGQILETPTLPTLPPHQPRGVPLALPFGGLRGYYPVVITMNFEDLNGYPFSTVNVMQVPTTDAVRSDLAGVLDEASIRGRTPVRMRIRNEKAEAITARYRLITPRELLAERGSGEVVVPAGGRVAVSEVVENFSALPNSQYRLHAVIEYDVDGRHYTTVAATPVTVLPPRALGKWYFWVALAVVGLAIAGSFLFIRK